MNCIKSRCIDLYPQAVTSAQVTSACHQALSFLQPRQQVEVFSSLFSHYQRQHCNIRVPEGFLELAIRGMQHLHGSGRSNVIYAMAKAVGTMRRDNSDSLLPVKRMPMGLVEYIVNFFTSSSIQKVYNDAV